MVPKLFRCKIVAFAAALGMASSAQGAMIYDNGSFAGGDRNITAFRSADDFVLGAPASVAAIRFWFTGIDPADFDGDMAYGFYEDSSGSLGTLLSSGSASGLSASFVSGLTYLLEFDLGAPVALGAGTYWLELHEGTTLTSDDGDSIYWSASAQTGNAKQDSGSTLPATSVDQELAFQLFDTPFTEVPEPGTLMLLGAGLGLLLMRVKRA